MKETDILIVGSGPAGLGAAIEAAECGAKVLLVDENRKAGGQLYKQIHKFFGSGAHYAGTRGFQIADMLLEKAREQGVQIWLDTRAEGLMDNGCVAVLHNERLEEIKAGKIILATGAKENALAFSGWDLPGVMTAGAAQTFSNVHGTLVGKRILMVGSGNVGLIVSYQLMQAGAEIAALVEAAPAITGYAVHAGKVKRAGVPVYTSHTVTEAHGNGHVEAAVIAEVDEHFCPIAGTEKKIDVDTILVAVGLNPRIEIASMFRCETTYEGALGGILPIHNCDMMSSNQKIYVCGDLAGVEEASTALDEGRLAGLCAASSLGFRCEGLQEKINSCRESLTALRDGDAAKRRRESKERIIGKGALCDV